MRSSLRIASSGGRDTDGTYRIVPSVPAEGNLSLTSASGSSDTLTQAFAIGGGRHENEPLRNVSNEMSEFPQQAATIAVRRTGETFQVCLIRERTSKTWGIPKGLVDPGDTHEGTALNEAWEEAGLTGRLIGEAVGTYQYDKWGTTFDVAVYLMEVLEQHDEWQEACFRERRWSSFEEAVLLLTAHPVRPLLDRATSLLADLA